MIDYNKIDRMRKAKKISDEEFFTSNKGWDDDIPTEVERPIYKGVSSKVRDAQRLLNMSMFTAIRVSEYTEEFNVWFEYQSFAWVPKFCKPLIKNWVKHSFMAGKGCFK